LPYAFGGNLISSAAFSLYQKLVTM